MGKRRFVRRRAQLLCQIGIIVAQVDAFQVRVHQRQQWILPEQPFAHIIGTFAAVVQVGQVIHFAGGEKIRHLRIARAEEIGLQALLIDVRGIGMLGEKLNCRQRGEDIAFHAVVAPQGEKGLADAFLLHPSMQALVTAKA